MPGSTSGSAGARRPCGVPGDTTGIPAAFTGANPARRRKTPYHLPVPPAVEPGSDMPGLWHWIRPHRTALLLAFLAAIAETIADVLQPWPIKLVLDNVVQHKTLSGWQARAVALLAGGGTWSILAA